LTPLSHAQTPFGRFASRPTLALTASSLSFDASEGTAVPARQPLWRQRLHSVLMSARRVAPVVLPMLLVSLLFLSPAFAAAPRTSQELRALIRERSGQSPIKGASFLRKLLMGVNAKGAIRNSKAGDTRAEMTMFLNGASMALILFVWGAVAQFGAKREEARQNSNMRREVMREKEYRENMYFEAAETILKKLAEPKLKGSVKASLTKQLQEIDPDGRIRAFLEGKADRPDLSKSLEQSRREKDEKRKKSASPLQKKKETKGSSKADLRDEEDDLDEDDGDDEPAPTRKSPPARPSASASPSSSSRSSRGNGVSSGSRASTSKSSAGAGADSMAFKVLNELEDSLIGVLPDAKREQLLEYLKARIDSISDEAKRGGVVNKIAEKLGDDQYWVDYAGKI